MIVVDSSVWIANLRNASTPAVAKLELIKPKGSILVGDLVLLEVLRGARDSTHASNLETMMRGFMIVEMMDEDIAVTAARNFRKLRGLGIPVRKTIDLVIATFCIAEGHQLLHEDRDFVPFEQHLGLRCL